MSKRSKYSDDFKREAVQLTVHPSVSINQIARKSDINRNQRIRRWPGVTSVPDH